jgi:tetratricopeptide (TPR) repeat protein
MKKLLIFIVIISCGFKAAAFSSEPDSSIQKVQPALTVLDSLQQQLTLTTNDSLKSGIYAQVAAEYLKYDKLTDKKTKLAYQTNALNYTYLALHSYSKYNDTTGLRVCFDNLSKIYRSQKKYSQAKWFILQSNSLSRIKNDVPNIMASLITLANIKMEIKDYKLALRDLNEALQLSTVNHYPKTESAVQESYALLYSHLKNYPKEAQALKRHDFIEDSIRKAEIAQLMAKSSKQDSVQAKKKVSPTLTRKVYKSSSRKIASI